MGGIRAGIIAAVATLLVAKGAAAQDLTLSGRILSGGQGVAAVTVKLAPSEPRERWIKITRTRSSGEYQFDDLKPGTYRIEVHRGVTLLHSGTVAVDASEIMDIQLAR